MPSESPAPGSLYPGPAALGRGVIVTPGAVPPEPWRERPRRRVDRAVLARPGPLLDELHEHWAHRSPLVIELDLSPDELRDTSSWRGPIWELDPTFEFPVERLQFLVWSNNYDARSGTPRWWWTVKAARLGAQPGSQADIVLPDGRHAWVDGGPRGPLELSVPVVHRESVELGHLNVARYRDPSDQLAPDQLEAVTHPHGSARIVAPAGSGKTRVLAARIRHLVGDRGVEPALITAVAYNTRAAGELGERLGPELPVEVRTLHSLGFDVIRTAARIRGEPAPRLIDEREVRSVLEPLVPVRPRANTDILAPYLDALGAVRLGLRDPSEVEAASDEVPDLTSIVPRYLAHLRRHGLVDFDELIHGALEALVGDPEVRAASRRHRRHLLVDEFQDLTPAYLLLVRLLAAPSYQVFGVGDDDQVIYGYAGATPGYLIDFDRYFPAATHHALEVNYRCPPPLVEAARTLLSHNRRRVDKTIRPPEDPNQPGEEAEQDEESVELLRLPGPQLAPELVGRIADWIEAGATPDSIAVLARVNATLLATQVLLTEHGIPCRRPIGAGVLQRTGMRAALAYLRLALGQGSWPTAELIEVVNRPSRRIARRVHEQFRRRRQWDAASLAELAAGLASRDADKLGGLTDDLVALGELARRADTAALLRSVRDDIGLGAALATLDRSKGGAEAAAHGDDLTSLLAVAALHPDPHGFEPWLRSILATDSEPDGVHLSSIHRVKGQEWDQVVLVGADGELMPHRLADDIEEERRIFHVAITRARRHLLVAADATNPSPLLVQLSTPADPSAPAAPPPRDQERGRPPTGPGRAAEVGLPVTLSGGFSGLIRSIEHDHVVIALDGGGITRVPFDSEIATEHGPVRLDRPAADADLIEALRAWRTERARSDGVPAYVVFSNAHLEGIAAARPRSVEQLAVCTGVGPTKLERYGDELLALIDDVIDTPAAEADPPRG